jgi:hypothetical protein
VVAKIKDVAAKHRAGLKPGEPQLDKRLPAKQ